jgi:hypothetical protein
VRNTRIAISLSLALSLACAAGVAGASTQPISGQIDDAKAAKAQAEAALARSEARLASITSQYQHVQSDLELAIRDVLTARFTELGVSAELAQAQVALDRRASQIFESGAGTSISVFLGAGSFDDLSFMEEFASRALTVDQASIARVEAARASLEAITGQLQQKQADLRASADRLQALSEEASAEFALADVAARKAGLAVKRLEAQKRALDEAQAAALAALKGFGEPGEIGVGCSSGAVHDLIVAAFSPLGQDQVDFALKIATRESNCRPNAYNKTVVPPYGNASGVFQILYPGIWQSWSAECGFEGTSPFDAKANVAVAACVVADEGWWPWGF